MWCFSDFKGFQSPGYEIPVLASQELAAQRLSSSLGTPNSEASPPAFGAQAHGSGALFLGDLPPQHLGGTILGSGASSLGVLPTSAVRNFGQR